MAHPKRKISKTRRIKDARITKLLISKLRLALPLEKLIYTTEHTGMRVNFTTEVKYSLMQRQLLKHNPLA